MARKQKKLPKADELREEDLEAIVGGAWTFFNNMNGPWAESFLAMAGWASGKRGMSEVQSYHYDRMCDALVQRDSMQKAGYIAHANYFQQKADESFAAFKKNEPLRGY